MTPTNCLADCTISPTPAKWSSPGGLTVRRIGCGRSRGNYPEIPGGWASITRHVAHGGMQASEALALRVMDGDAWTKSLCNNGFTWNGKLIRNQ